MKKYLTIDIGGTVIKSALMWEDYTVEREESLPTPAKKEAFLFALQDLAVKYREQVEGIALCIGGFLDPETGENTDFSVSEKFRAYNLKEELKKASGGLPVTIENDSNCAAYGELTAGAGQNYRDFCLLTIGTGIGGAIVVDRKLVRGAHDKAGEAGFMLLDRLPAEQRGATSVLVRRVSKRLGRQVDGIYIFDHLSDPEIEEIYHQWVSQLALIVGNMAVLLDPEAVLIGGGVCSQKRLISDLRREVYDSFEHLEEYTAIEACSTGNLAGRIGALCLLKEELNG